MRCKGRPILKLCATQRRIQVDRMSGVQRPEFVTGALAPKLLVLGWILLSMLAFAASGWCGSVEPLGPDRSTASLSQTEDWIRRRGTEFSQNPYRNSRWSFPSDCRLRIEAPELDSVQVQELNLSAVDPVTIAVYQLGSSEHWGIVEGGNGTRTLWRIAKHRVGQAEHLSPPAYNVGILIASHESATRVARALKHAAILCGAKVDPF